MPKNKNKPTFISYSMGMKFQKGVSDWRILFTDGTILDLKSVKREAVITTFDEITIYLQNAEQLINLKEIFFDNKEVQKIIQAKSILENFGGITRVLNITQEYDDMYISKIVNSCNTDDLSGFNIIFKNIKKG